MEQCKQTAFLQNAPQDTHCLREYNTITFLGGNTLGNGHSIPDNEYCRPCPGDV